MEKGTHGKNELSFENLDYAGQARSINGHLSVLEKMLNIHFEKGKTENKDVKKSCESYKKKLTDIVNQL